MRYRINVDLCRSFSAVGNLLDVVHVLRRRLSALETRSKY